LCRRKTGMFNLRHFGVEESSHVDKPSVTLGIVRPLFCIGIKEMWSLVTLGEYVSLHSP
jgi:hypothetical protein